MVFLFDGGQQSSAKRDGGVQNSPAADFFDLCDHGLMVGKLQIQVDELQPGPVIPGLANGIMDQAAVTEGFFIHGASNDLIGLEVESVGI